MPRRSGRLFAGRRITLKAVAITTGVVALAFGLGIVVGWGTTLVADALKAEPSPTASPSPSETPSPTADVSVPPTPPISREIDADDRAAGLTSLDIPREGPGTFSPVSMVPGGGADAVVTKLVRIDAEDGLPIAGPSLANFVMSTLNDPRGWAAQQSIAFVQTEGVADLRIVLATPTTAAAACAAPHVPAALTPGVSPTPEPTPSPSTSASLAVQKCPSSGTIVISAYDWAAGLAAFEEDRPGARTYLLLHGVGHALGEADTECSRSRGTVMVDVATKPEACVVNTWVNAKAGE